MLSSDSSPEAPAALPKTLQLRQVEALEHLASSLAKLTADMEKYVLWLASGGVK